MTYKLSDIVYETKNHFVLRVAKGFEVYRTGITHSTRCAQIGWDGQKGIDRAIAEVRRREPDYEPPEPAGFEAGFAANH